jgi:AraC-like DNA-binding protein
MAGSLLAVADGFSVTDVRCSAARSGFAEPELADRHVLVILRRGAFIRRVDGREVLLDATTGYLAAPGLVEQFAHPAAGGDRCGRPGTAAAYRRVAELAQAEMLAEPALGLVEVSRRVGCSPHHLSRVFSRLTGAGLSRYRNRLRVGLALERLGDGEADLAALAADLGFADHAHLTRTIRAHTGRTPTACRDLLRTSEAPAPERSPGARGG